jgi:hypothetical protein
MPLADLAGDAETATIAIDGARGVAASKSPFTPLTNDKTDRTDTTSVLSVMSVSSIVMEMEDAPIDAD